MVERNPGRSNRARTRHCGSGLRLFATRPARRQEPQGQGVANIGTDSAAAPGHCGLDNGAERQRPDRMAATQCLSVAQRPDATGSGRSMAGAPDGSLYWRSRHAHLAQRAGGKRFGRKGDRDRPGTLAKGRWANPALGRRPNGEMVLEEPYKRRTTPIAGGLGRGATAFRKRTTRHYRRRHRNGAPGDRHHRSSAGPARVADAPGAARCRSATSNPLGRHRWR